MRATIVYKMMVNTSHMVQTNIWCKGWEQNMRYSVRVITNILVWIRTNIYMLIKMIFDKHIIAKVIRYRVENNIIRRVRSNTEC